MFLFQIKTREQRRRSNRKRGISGSQQETLDHASDLPDSQTLRRSTDCNISPQWALHPESDPSSESMGTNF